MKSSLLISVAALLVFGCSKNNSLNNTTSSASIASLSDTAFIADTTDFYDITLNDIRTVHVVGHKLISFAGSSGDTATNIIDYAFFSDTSLYADLEFHKGAIKKTAADSSFLFLNKEKINNLLPGQYIYTKDPKIENGVYLVLRDSKGVTWSTKSGTGDQTGSSFSIVKQLNFDKNFASTGISHSIHIVCILTCNIYDGQGHQMKITNDRLGLTLWI